MPTFADVVLLLPFDGADGSTTYTDFSLSPKTLTRTGTAATISTAQSQFGGASLTLNGNSHLSTPDSPDWHFGAGDFTIECWIRPNGINASRGLVSQRAFFNSNNSFSFYTVDGQLRFAYSTNGTADPVVVLGPSNVVDLTWQHVAVVRSGTTLRVYRNGVGGASHNIGTASLFNSTNPLRIAQLESGIGGQFFSGHIDDLRISRAAWYTADFTPPTSALPTSDPPAGILATPGPLGSPSLLAASLVSAYAAAPGPLGAASLLASLSTAASISLPGVMGSPSISAFHDFTGLIQGVSSRYYGLIFGPFGELRVPISSWQATARDTGSSYLQCVVPACGPYLDEINAALAFSVVREAVIPGGGSVSYTMATAEMSAPTVSTGPRSQSATLSGYTPALSLPAAETLTLTLLKVRAVFSRPGGLMVRSNIDWLLRPGMQAVLDGQPFPVSYINYFVNANDQFMDVGERVAEIA